jgi:hypothetical protein
MAVVTTTGRRTNKQGAAARHECKHHWVIESANGRVSTGFCRLCGARKDFMNHLRDCVKAGDEEYEEWLSKQRE